MTAVVRPASFQALVKHLKDFPLRYLGSCALHSLLMHVSARAGLFSSHCSHLSKSILVKRAERAEAKLPTADNHNLFIY